MRKRYKIEKRTKKRWFYVGRKKNETGWESFYEEKTRYKKMTFHKNFTIVSAKKLCYAEPTINKGFKKRTKGVMKRFSLRNPNYKKEKRI